MSEVHEVPTKIMDADPMINNEYFRVFMECLTPHAEKYSK